MTNRKIKAHVQCLQGLPAGASGKEFVCQCRRQKRCGFSPWVGKIPWRRRWQPTLALLPGESHGQKSLAGYSPRVTKSQPRPRQLSPHTLTGLYFSQAPTYTPESICCSQGYLYQLLCICKTMHLKNILTNLTFEREFQMYTTF